MRRANPAVIGGFILGAVVLVTAGVLILGSGKLFATTLPCVMYFEGSIQGLQVGAPVNFRGVKVGSVTDIKMQFDPQNIDLRIPVFVEFPTGPRGSMELLNKGSGTPHAAMTVLIRRGLRAQLQTESLVTGLLFVQLDLYPSTSVETPPGETLLDPKTGLLEIPTVPTTLQEVSNTVRKVLDTLAKLPLEQMLREFQQTLSGINQLVNAPEVLEAVRSANVTLSEIQSLMREANQQVKLVGSSATTALGSLDKLAGGMHHLAQQVDKQLGHVAANTTMTLGNISKLAQSVDKQALALTTSLTHTVAAVVSTLEQMRDTLASVHQLITPNAPVGYELVKTLRELSDAARSLRGLAEYLERHPNAVIFGRQGSGAK